MSQYLTLKAEKRMHGRIYIGFYAHIMWFWEVFVSNASLPVVNFREIATGATPVKVSMHNYKSRCIITSVHVTNNYPGLQIHPFIEYYCDYYGAIGAGGFLFLSLFLFNPVYATLPDCCFQNKVFFFYSLNHSPCSQIPPVSGRICHTEPHGTFPIKRNSSQVIKPEQIPSKAF